MPARSRPIALLAAVAALCLVPAGNAMGATSGFGDPLGDSPQFAPDLGATTVTVSDDAISVETEVLPRPPAGWGGCAYTIGEACIPAEMSVTWYLDYLPGAGSVADDGADATVVVEPQPGRSLWESARWSAAGERFLPGPRPLGSEAPGSVRWSLRLSDLGVERPTTVRIWAVSLFGAQPGLGAPIDYEDRAGPGVIFLGELGAAGADASPATRCKRRGALPLRVRVRRLADIDVAPGWALKRRCRGASLTA